MVQLEILRGYSGAEGKIKAGEIVTVDAKRAEEILSKPGRARLAEGQASPTEQEKPEKKSSGAPTDGRSSSTPSSSAPGQDSPSSASPAAPVSRNPNARWWEQYARAVKALFGSSR